MKVEVKSFAANIDYGVVKVTAAVKAETYINERLGQGWGLEHFGVTTTPRGEPTITVCMVSYTLPLSVRASQTITDEEFAENQPHPVAPYDTPPASPVPS